MAMLSIKVENGVFVEGKGITILDSTHAEGDGWICERTDKKIVCYAKQEYPDGEHIIKYIINMNNGSIILLLIVPNKERKILNKVYKNKKVSDGELVLSPDNVEVDRRYAFYREKVFKDFLETYHIDKCIYLTKEQLANLILPTDEYVKGKERYHSQVITNRDPLVLTLYTSVHQSDNGFVYFSTGFNGWVIYDEERKEAKIKKRILYTSIKDFDTLTKEIEKKEEKELAEVLV